MDNKRNVFLRFDQETFINLRRICAEKDVTYSEFLKEKINEAMCELRSGGEDGRHEAN